MWLRNRSRIVFGHGAEIKAVLMTWKVNQFISWCQQEFGRYGQGSDTSASLSPCPKQSRTRTQDFPRLRMRVRRTLMPTTLTQTPWLVKMTIKKVKFQNDHKLYRMSTKVPQFITLINQIQSKIWIQFLVNELKALTFPSLTLILIYRFYNLYYINWYIFYIILSIENGTITT